VTEHVHSSSRQGFDRTRYPGRETHPRGLSLQLTVLELILRRLEVGRLELVWPDRAPLFFGDDRSSPATWVIRDPSAVRRILLGGSLGFAEGFLDGLWDTPDLPALLDLFAANIRSGALVGKSVPGQPIQRMAHLARANTRYGARRNIQYHYDLGNDFYSLWLDPTMTYSCAAFRDVPDNHAAVARPEELLATAQCAKWDSILDLVEPEPGSRLLEIGSGWGGFAIHAALTRGCRVVGITLSEEQLAYAREAARAAGVDGHVEFRLLDYRDLDETFDHVVSIEMFEAVGERYWQVFFQTVRRALRPGGRAAMQVITIAEERFAAYRRRADYTQVYIFPGGMLPSPGAFTSSAAEAGLTVGEPRFMAPDYAQTLLTWLDRFDNASDEVRALGFDERFIRMWRYYLALCAAGFRHRLIDVMQVRLEATRG
jgi:cyclopropane-fatty-acyl-phospholipid synthase